MSMPAWGWMTGVISLIIVFLVVHLERTSLEG